MPQRNTGAVRALSARYLPNSNRDASRFSGALSPVRCKNTNRYRVGTVEGLAVGSVGGTWVCKDGLAFHTHQGAPARLDRSDEHREILPARRKYPPRRNE